MKLPLITNIQKYSIHDGRGIRTTVFFKGCPLACRWCHNPEAQSYEKELTFYEERCLGCGACVEECGNGAIEIKDAKAVTRRERCSACGSCMDSCIHNARELCGRTYTISEMVKELLKDRAFYETSGGGVTLSGGEPLAQAPDYVEALMRTLARRGISVNVDTCGAVPFEAMERMLPYTDTFLYDLKIMNEKKHKEYTGRENRQILKNLQQLSRKGARIWIRIPVIGGVNDQASEMEEIAGFLKENAVQVEQINLIPYHNTGSGKYLQLDRKYEGEAFTVPSKGRMLDLQQLIQQRNIAPVFIGG